jgi:hypothetical protein
MRTFLFHEACGAKYLSLKQVTGLDVGTQPVAQFSCYQNKLT